MKVLDASALLAFLQGEPGADVVERALDGGGVCGAANWSEVAQKVQAHGRSWDLARGLLESYDLEVVPVSLDDAERGAARWSDSPSLSLADRLCLALGDRLDVPVLTANKSWGKGPRIQQIR